jgi:peroxiredoxin
MKRPLRLCLAVLAIVPLLGCEYIAPLSPGERLAGMPLRVGDYVPDFEAFDSKGYPKHFSDIRGDVTVLAIVAAQQPGKCEVLDSLRDLVARETSIYADVEYVSVTQPAAAKFDPKAKIAICPKPKLWHVIPLCDEGAKVKTLYGAAKLGVYYIIDDDSRVAAIGDMSDLPTLKKNLDKPVRKAEWDNCLWNSL